MDKTVSQYAFGVDFVLITTQRKRIRFRRVGTSAIYRAIGISY